MPLLGDTINKLTGAQYFTKFDVRWGYNNICIKERDEWKVALITNQGLFEPLVMFFGLCNSPSTFQNMMNDIFHELIIMGKVCVYLDDILIFTSTKEEHVAITSQVLEILRDNKLYLKLSKCEFKQEECEYLEHILLHNVLKMDPVKVKAITNWPELKSKKEVQQFLGFLNFYRRFIQDFGAVLQPLTKLTGKEPWQ